GLAAALGALRPDRPSRRGSADRLRLAGGGRVPRRLDPGLRRDLAGRAAARRLAGRRRRRRAVAEAQPRRRDRDMGTDVGPAEVRPAFYALRRGGWRDYVTVLHLPYTLWNLAYVALGASLAPHFRTERMLWTMAAFALALGVAAHMLDELNGRPLGTQIGSRTLAAVALAALAGACAIGVWAAFEW